MNSRRPSAARPSDRRRRDFYVEAKRTADRDEPARWALSLDRKAWRSGGIGELCRIHRPLVLKIARRITGNLEDAQDAVQDSLLRAYLAIRSFDERAKFRTWLTRITINSCLLLLRKRRTIPAASANADGYEGNPDEIAELVAPELNPESSLLLLERSRAVRHAVEGLPEEY